MKKNLQKIDRIFFKALDNYNEEPNENIWSAIENDLNKKDAEKYKSRYTSLRKAFIYTIVTTVCLLAAGIIQFSIYHATKNKISNVPFLIKQNLINTKDANVNRSAMIIKQNVKPLFANSPVATIKDEEVMNTDNANEKTENKTYSFSSDEPIENIISNSVISIVPSSPVIFKKNISFNPIQNFNTNSNPNKAKQKHSFYIIPFGSLDHVMNKSEEEYEFNNENASEVEEREKTDMSYTAGVLFEYGISKKISVQSGLSISNSFTSISPTVVKAYKDNFGQYKFKLATTYGLAEIKKTGIPQSGDSILLNSATMHLQYFSIPMLMKINLKPGKFNVSSSGGIVINSIIGDKVEVNYATATSSENETVQKIEGLKNVFFTLEAGAEASYSINKYIAVGINPGIRYAITPVNKGTPVKTYPVTLGIGAALHIKL